MAAAERCGKSQHPRIDAPSNQRLRLTGAQTTVKNEWSWATATQAQDVGTLAAIRCAFRNGLFASRMRSLRSLCWSVSR